MGTHLTIFIGFYTQKLYLTLKTVNSYLRVSPLFEKIYAFHKNSFADSTIGGIMKTFPKILFQRENEIKV